MDHAFPICEQDAALKSSQQGQVTIELNEVSARRPLAVNFDAHEFVQSDQPGVLRPIGKGSPRDAIEFVITKKVIEIVDEPVIQVEPSISLGHQCVAEGLCSGIAIPIHEGNELVQAGKVTKVDMFREDGRQVLFQIRVQAAVLAVVAGIGGHERNAVVL
jgi:hypothetical protein